MKASHRRWFCLAFVLLFSASPSVAQGTREDYHRAEQFLPANLRHRVYVAEVVPPWIAKKNRFWYHKVGTNGAEFLLVDADQNTAGPAFDHAKNFDQLIVPNMYHGEGGNPYLIRRRWDYFVQYLLGLNPPPDFAIHEERENAPARAR
jgi:hypothetical protein